MMETIKIQMENACMKLPNGMEDSSLDRKTLQVIRFIPDPILTLKDKKNEERWRNWDRLSYMDVNIYFYSKLFQSNKRFHGNKEAVELCTVLATEMA